MTDTREVLLMQLRATHATLEAALQQVEVAIVAIAEDGDGSSGEACPRCKGEDFADAGATPDGETVRVCGGCNANVAGGRVIGG